MTKAKLEVSGVGDLPPPVIEIGPVNQTIPEGQPATMSCETSGKPRPEVQWFFKNKDLIDEDDDDRVTIDQLGMLTIKGLRFEDSGVYTCVAASETGETRQAATLTVASVHDPNVAFSRAPLPELLPAAPSTPRAINISDTSVTLSWDRPGRGMDDNMAAMSNGGFHRVKAYTIEYFSADLQSGWVTVANRIGSTETFTVTSLKPDTRYVFVIRAENALGTGRPSKPSKEIRTLGSRTAGAPDHYLSRARTQLSVTEVTLQSVRALNSTALSLDWTMSGDRDFVEGFYIRFKEIADSSNTYNIATAWGSKVTRYVLRDLKKFTTYELFLVPFYRSVEGSPSNTRSASTLEDVPSAPVNEVSVNVVNSSSVRVMWKPPLAQHRNGILLGYKLLLVGSTETANQNELTNATYFDFSNLIHRMPYKLQVVPYTAVGDGPSYVETFSIDESSQPDVAISGRPLLVSWWLIAVLCLSALAIVCLIIYFCRKQQAHKTTVSALPPLISKGGDINSCFTASLTHHPVVSVDTWTPINGCYGGDNHKNSHESTTTVYENKLSALDHGISYCAEYALPNVKESEYAEVGQNLNTFGKRYQGMQHGHTPEPYASTTLIHGPLDGIGSAATIRDHVPHSGITLNSLTSRTGSAPTRYSNAVLRGGTGTGLMGAAPPATATTASAASSAVAAVGAGGQAHELENLLQAAVQGSSGGASIHSSSADSGSFGRRSGLSAGSQHTDCSSCNGMTVHGGCCSDECPSEPIYNTVPEEIGGGGGGGAAQELHCSFVLGDGGTGGGRGNGGEGRGDGASPPTPTTAGSRNYNSHGGLLRGDKKQLKVKTLGNAFSSLQHMDDSITLPSYTKPSLFSPNMPAASRRGSAVTTRAQL